MLNSTKKSGHPILSQLISYIPRDLLDQCVSEFDSDKYYKTMTTHKQFISIFYGVVSRSPSLNSLCKNLSFCQDSLARLSIDKLPASSTLSDANSNRNSEVFGKLYHLLLDLYSDKVSSSYVKLMVNNEVSPKKVKIFDSTTISLFTDIFKAAGRNPLNGKKKGGIKVQTVISLSSRVPEIIHLDQASKNDKDFLGQLQVVKDNIYVFDKGYVNYTVWQEWTDKGAFFTTRLNENAKFDIIESKAIDCYDFLGGGIVKDQVISLGLPDKKDKLKTRLITYRDPETGVLLKFVSNMFEHQAETIIRLYKSRWEIETVFKQLKQNFELGSFYSDSSEGIKTQIWIALIANLIFTVIYKQVKECEQFFTIVSMASANLSSKICLITILKTKILNSSQRDIEITQMHLFDIHQGVPFEKHEEQPQ